MNLEKVENMIDSSLSNGFSPMEKGFEVHYVSGQSLRVVMKYCLLHMDMA